MVFTVMHMDEPVANVTISEDKKNVEIQKLVPDSIKQPFGGNKLNLERVYDFLKGRCYEDGRADLQEILLQAGLASNNPWEWVKITHGVTYEDMFWVRFPDEDLTWEDVRVR
ncbi:hypothetical protein [Lacrimispora sp.]|uniref:hypothetical protein n=1 Tax=Lacrimispora sp. TaxID=2719234 RepID=UPI002FD8AB5C